MAKIDRINLGPVQVDARISPGTAAEANIAAARASQDIQAIGQSFFEEAKAASDNAAYAKAISQATEELTKRSQERLSQRTDDDGNPTFERLPKDMQSISSQVKSDILSSISSPDVRRRFEIEFHKHSTNNQLLALRQARAQQLDFSRANVSDSLASLEVQAAQADPSALDGFLNTGKDILAEGVRTGALTAEEASQREASFEERVQFEQARQQLQDFPEATLEALDEGATFGLSVRGQQQLKAEAKAAVIDKQRAEEEALEEQQKALLNQQQAVAHELEVGLIDGTAGRADILAAHHDGQISDKDMRSLELKAARADAAAAKSNETIAVVSQKISAGESLVNVKPSHLDEYLESRVANLEDKSLTNITVKEVSKVKGQFPRFKKQLQDSLIFGSNEDALDAVQAVQILERTNPRQLLNMNADARAIYASASDSIKSNMNPSRAIELAKQTRDPVKGEELAKREKEYRKMKDVGVADMIRDVADNIGEMDFGEATNVDPLLVDLIDQRLGKAFAKHNDLDKAKKDVEIDLKSIAGETSFNGGDLVMYMPPERAFPDIPAEVLKEDLLSDVRSFVPNATHEDIQIQYDDFTGVYFVTVAGEDLLQGNGIPVPWTFDQANYRKSEREHKDEIFKEVRSERKAKAGFLETMAENGGLVGEALAEFAISHGVETQERLFRDAPERLKKAFEKSKKERGTN